jgi:hypothetical protein
VLSTTTHFMMGLFGVIRESSEPNQVGIQGAAGAATYGLTGDIMSAIIIEARNCGKTVQIPTLKWSGPQFTVALDTGPLDRTSKSRQGTTVVKSSYKLSLTGRYDPAARSIVDVKFAYETSAASDFTPDPNWKPRDRLEAELGAPKPNKSQSLTAWSIQFDSVPLAGPPVRDAGGLALSVSFLLDGKSPREGCMSSYRQESNVNGEAKVISHRTVLGPQTKGAAFQAPTAYFHFLIPKQ